MIICKSKAELEKMRRSCLLVHAILQELQQMVGPGVTTLDLDRVAEKRIEEAGAQPAFKGYRGFPNALCASVNDEIVHGIPSNRKLKVGDIVGLDFGVILDGYYGDAAITVPVGNIGDELKALLAVTEESLNRAIEKVKVGNRVSDIGAAVQEYVEAHGYSVVRDFVGHGIGTALHEDPQVPNYGVPGRGPQLKEGMVLAIEPMVNQGGPNVRVLDDHWTAVTADGSYSAHFEHTVAVTQNGAWVLTRP